MATAAIMIFVGKNWLVPRDWKYYLLCAIAATRKGWKPNSTRWIYEEVNILCRRRKARISEH